MLSKTHSKYIQSLHHKKFRDAENAFIAEGSKVITELLLQRKFICTQLLATASWLQNNAVLLKQYVNTAAMYELQDFELEKISALATPNQVLAVFNKNDTDTISGDGKISLALDTIQDPGNLGTLIRIADWFGITAIICSPDCADKYNPKVVQSTMGSLARVEVLYTHLPTWLQQHRHIDIYATALDGIPVQELGAVTEAVIVTGNESKGISHEVMQQATAKITIPKIGGAESLNAAVATGIILSHIIKG